MEDSDAQGDPVRTPAPSARFVEQLRSSIGGRFGNAGGWEVEPISHRGPPGRERRVFRAHDPATGRSLAVKANALHLVNLRQYRALRSLRLHVEDCVTPFYIDPRWRFFVMEWVDAPPLLQRLHEEGPGRDEALSRAGRWLAHLHEVTARRPSPGNWCHSMRLLIPYGTGPLRRAAGGLFARMRRISLGSGPTAMIHGDFQPGNLFDLGDRLVAFDRQSDRHGTVFFDVAWFLSHLADGRARAAQRGRPWPGEAEADRRAFLGGYGPVAEADLARFDLVEDLVLFRRWRYLIRRGNHRLDEQVRMRGLLDSEAPASRPGRLVAAPGGATWTTATLVSGMR